MKRVAAICALAALLIAGCGDSGSGESGGKLIVSAAASLKQALPKYEPDASYSFAGSD